VTDSLYRFAALHSIVPTDARSALPHAPVWTQPPRRPPRVRLAVARGLERGLNRAADAAGALADRLARHGGGSRAAPGGQGP